MENKIYCTDGRGHMLFYIYLIDKPEECVMNLNCSINRSIIFNKDTERMINCLQERKVVEPLRSEFIEKLFQYIMKIPGIEKYYLKCQGR